MHTRLKVFTFAGALSLAAAACGGAASSADPATPRTGTGTSTGQLAIEKPQLKLGFIKLTDMVPLAIAYEKGFFEDEGLEVEFLWAQAAPEVIQATIGGSAKTRRG